MLTLERIKSLPKDNVLSEDYCVLAIFETQPLKLVEGVLRSAGAITINIDDLMLETWTIGAFLESFNIEEYFIDWLNPTQEENTLWTLETGLETIETYVEQMEKMMKEFK